MLCLRNVLRRCASSMWSLVQNEWDVQIQQGRWIVAVISQIGFLTMSNNTFINAHISSKRGIYEVIYFYDNFT